METTELDYAEQPDSINEKSKIIPTCSTYYETDCVYDFDLRGSYYQQTIEDKILDLINEDRVSNGVKSMAYSSEATNHAYIHSKSMASIDIQEHSKSELRTWRDDSGLVRRSCGENIWNLYNPFDPVTLGQNTNQGYLDFETSSASRPQKSDSVTLDDIANWIHAGAMGSPWGHS